MDDVGLWKTGKIAGGERLLLSLGSRGSLLKTNLQPGTQKLPSATAVLFLAM